MPTVNGSYYADASTPAALAAITAAMASAEDARFASTAAIKGFRAANTAALAALTGMTTGDLAMQTDTAITYRYSGSAWKAWESDRIVHVPTLTNVTVGNGTLACWYQWRQGIVRHHFELVFGSTSALSGVPVYSIPVNQAALVATREIYLGTAAFWNTSSTNRHVGVVSSNGTAVDALAILATGGTNGGTQNPSTTIPLGEAFAVGDAITGDCEYVPA